MRTIFSICFFLSFALVSFAAEKPLTIAGHTAGEAMRLGEQMYRAGLLPSGEPIEATVQGDIPIDGSMFTCESCHLRSGLGSTEGTYITLPTNGADLYRPYVMGSETLQPLRKTFADQYQKVILRPAYTDEDLAEALLLGVDPAGRELEEIMPRYDLDDDSMEILIHYLKNLTVTLSPGVNDKTITFATIATDDVPKEQKEAMYQILDAYVRDKNSQGRYQERRAKDGPFFRLEKYTAYRRIELKKWQLHGEPETWQAQLEEYYNKDKIFGFIGGISTRDWKPIHEFCERNKIPSLFPITNYPVISESDWYTLYFSKGLYQEGESTARYLREAEGIETLKILQVFRDDLPGQRLSRGFAETWKLLRQTPSENKILNKNEETDPEFWQKLVDNLKADIVLLWLPPEDLKSVDALAFIQGRPDKVFISSTQQGKTIFSLPQSVRNFIYITYPYDLPQDGYIKKLALKNWLEIRKIPLSDVELQGKMFFLNRMLTGALKVMRRDYYRERFLEGIDMMIDQNYTVPVYPNLSFGPAQRYASKGCYIVQLDNDPEPLLVKRSKWINH